MTITNGYITAVNFKSRAFDGDTTVTKYDTEIDAVINAVSRWIDDYCRRRFFGVSEARCYTPLENYTLYVDDILSVDTLGSDTDGDRTYEDTWSVTDYDLMPYSAALDSKPYTWIETTPQGSYAFPAGVRKAVKLEGTFGYCTYATAAPYEVQEACYIQASRIFKRKDSPFGIAGRSEMGTIEMIPRLDADVKTLLDPFVKHF